MPFLSIIIPSFQQSTLLRNLLNSIVKQTFRDYEILVIDGGSKDDTAEVVAEFKHLPIKFYSEPDKGIYDAMNKGINYSSGAYLYFIGCDDSLASSHVLEDIFSIKDITNNHVIYGDVIFIKNNVRYNGEFNYFKLLASNICHQAIFTHRKVFDVLGNFDVRYKSYADWEFNMRWFNALWIKQQYIPVIIANFNTSGFSSSLKDEIFFAEETALKKKYFPKIITHLVSNRHKPVYWRLVKLLTTRRVALLEKLIRLSS